MVENIEQVVRKIISENCDSKRVNEISLTENLQDLGINSFSFVEIIVILERVFGIKFDDESLRFEQYETLQSIISNVEEEIKNKETHEGDDKSSISN